MGEMVVSTNPAEELVALGLGSCIGLAIVDRSAGVAGLAHIVLPESQPGTATPGKFADTAVPELLERLRGAGAVNRRMEVAIVGGARMFETSQGLDIGARNEHAVRAELSKARLTVRAAETGGSQGRTVKVAVGQGLVTMRVAGQPAVTLLGDKPRPAGARTAHARGAHAAVRTRVGKRAVRACGAAGA